MFVFLITTLKVLNSSIITISDDTMNVTGLKCLKYY